MFRIKKASWVSYFANEYGVKYGRPQLDDEEEAGGDAAAAADTPLAPSTPLSTTRRQRSSSSSSLASLSSASMEVDDVATPPAAVTPPATRRPLRLPAQRAVIDLTSEAEDVKMNDDGFVIPPSVGARPQVGGPALARPASMPVGQVAVAASTRPRASSSPLDRPSADDEWTEPRPQLRRLRRMSDPPAVPSSSSPVVSLTTSASVSRHQGEGKEAEVEEVDDDDEEVIDAAHAGATIGVIGVGAATGLEGDYWPSLDELLSIKSAKWFWRWAFLLGKKLARLLLFGLRMADGKGATGSAGRESQRCIYTSSVRFRDELMRFLCHAGFSTHFYRYRRRGQTVSSVKDHVIRARHDGWAVEYHDNNIEEVLQCKRDVTPSQYDGTVYCVKVPNHLVFAHRVQAVENGRIISVSRTIVIGQCRRDDLESIGYMLMYFLNGTRPPSAAAAAAASPPLPSPPRAPLHRAVC